MQTSANQAIAKHISLAKRGQLSLEALVSSCNRLQAEGKNDDCINLYLAWLNKSQHPLAYLAWYNLGALVQSLGGHGHAAEIYQRALASKPDFAVALINLGLCLEVLGRFDEAIATWLQVSRAETVLGAQAASKDATLGLADVPPWPEGEAREHAVIALNHQGRLLEDLKRYDEAERALEASLALNPRQVDAIQHWVHIQQKTCDWPILQELAGVSHNAMILSMSPLPMLAVTDDPVQQLLTAREFGRRKFPFDDGALYRKANPSSLNRKARKLKIGYVSGDLCTHAVGLLLPDFLEAHDKDRVEVYLYDYSPEDGTPTRQRILAAADQALSIKALSDQQAAEVIVKQEIDVLVDLHGLSQGARPAIFAARPAAIQAQYLGYIGTTGFPWIDYVITDQVAFPRALEPYFSEKPLMVEGSFIPLGPPPIRTVVRDRQACGLPQDRFVLAAMGNVYKIKPELFACWMRILQKHREAVLWLIDDNPVCTANLLAQAKNFSVDGQLIFGSRAPYGEFVGRLSHADVCLDSFPYNCGSTARDIVHAGVPYVSLAGKTMVSRMGASVLHALGLAECAVASIEAYEAIVGELLGSEVDRRRLRDGVGQAILTWKSQVDRVVGSVEARLGNLVFG